MRPTDENQRGSTRPNLLSGGRRRVAEDNNILARLERDSARQALGNRSRAAWHAVAAVLIVVLVLFVGWLAYDNAVAPSTALQPAPVETVRPAVTLTDRDPASTPGVATTAVLPHALSPETPAGPATPAPQPAPAAGIAASLPPPVLLQDHQAPSVKPASPARDARPAAVIPVAPGKVAPRERPSAHPAVTPTRAPAHPRQTGMTSLTTEAVVDTDVALLSAIIIHDRAHAAEKAQMVAAAACARTTDKHCRRRVVRP